MEKYELQGYYNVIIDESETHQHLNTTPGKIRVGLGIALFCTENQERL